VYLDRMARRYSCIPSDLAVEMNMNTFLFNCAVMKAGAEQDKFDAQAAKAKAAANKRR